jgi:hypothetical protein
LSPAPDRDAKRWYWTVTIAGWLLAIEAASSLLMGIAGRAMAGSFSLESALAQAGLVPRTVGAGTLDAFTRQIMVATDVQIAANAVLVAGCIGLLLRRKWGWYTVTILHVAEAVVGFILGLPLVRSAVAVVAPEQAMTYGLLITILICLVPLSVVAFLMLAPVARQFEPPQSASVKAG